MIFEIIFRRDKRNKDLIVPLTEISYEMNALLPLRTDRLRESILR
jgi:hypothetical protein